MARLARCLASLVFVGVSVAVSGCGGTALDQFIEAKMLEAKTPGLAVGIVRNGRLVMVKGYGFANLSTQAPVDADTVFRLASVSKTVVATAVMRQVEQGKLTLDADVGPLLPFKLPRPITLRMLLTHTSSIHDRDTIWDEFTVDGDARESLGEFLQGYLAVGGSHYRPEDYLPGAPGSTYEYSNVGTALAAYLVERVTHQPFDQDCQDHVFRPLAMTSTSWHLSGAPADHALPYQTDGDGLKPRLYSFAFYPSGGLHSNVPDLAKHLVSFMDATLLAPATVAQMETPQIPALDPDQGLIWYRAKSGDATVIGHTGGNIGVSTRVFFEPETHDGVIVLANHDPDDKAPLEAIEGRLFDEAKSF